MRAFCCSLFFFLSLQALATSPVAKTEVISLSKCLKLSAFDEKDIVRRFVSPGHDRIFYDYSHWKVEKILILSFDISGKISYEKERVRCTPESEHFEIIEAEGNEADLADRIRYDLKQKKQPFACPVEVHCFD